jgi:ubiquinone/menaquinone biosynthesis C-methylase UbiE
VNGPGSGSVSFDRAAEYYDRTRTLPADTAERLTRTLADELRGRGIVLEVGVGTGRIAVPLSRAGIPMTGVDLSAPMLRRLAQNAGGTSPFPVVQGDATALPFRPASFGAALACHVLHLIPRWREALAAMARAVRPGGVVLIDPGTQDAGWWTEVQDQFGHAAGVGPKARFVGTHDPREIDAAMAALGPKVRLLPPVPGHDTESIEEVIGKLEEGLYSWTWKMDEPRRARAAEETRRWAAGAMGDLDEPREGRWEITWRAYDIPS